MKLCWFMKSHAIGPRTHVDADRPAPISMSNGNRLMPWYSLRLSVWRGTSPSGVFCSITIWGGDGARRYEFECANEEAMVVPVVLAGDLKQTCTMHSAYPVIK